MSEVGLLHIGYSAFDERDRVYFRLRYYSQAYIMGKPGYGKDSLAKTLMVLASKKVKLLVFDFRGELLAHITRPNPESEEPSCVSPYKACVNFTFPLSDFKDAEDWVSMGFREEGAYNLSKLLQDTAQYHGWIPQRILDMLAELPTGERMRAGDEVAPVERFNNRYGAQIIAPVQWHDKMSWINNLQVLLSWFWQGKGDERQIIDFAREWQENDHLIVNFSDKNGNHDARIYRAFLGKILQQLRTAGYRRYRGLVVIEEASAAVPYWPHGMRPSSNRQVDDLAKLGRKDHMKILLIFQNMKQVDKQLLSGGSWQVITGQLTDNDMGLRYEPDANEGKGYRQFIMTDIDGRKKIFVPRIPVCLYETR